VAFCGVLSSVFGDSNNSNTSPPKKRGRPAGKSSQKQQPTTTPTQPNTMDYKQEFGENCLSGEKEKENKYPYPTDLFNIDNKLVLNPLKFRQQLYSFGGAPSRKLDSLKGGLLNIIYDTQSILYAMGKYSPSEFIFENLPEEFQKGGPKQRLKIANNLIQESEKTLSEISDLLFRFGELWPKAFEASYAAEAYKAGLDASNIQKEIQKVEAWQEKEAKKEETHKRNLKKYSDNKSKRKSYASDYVRKSVMQSSGAIKYEPPNYPPVNSSASTTSNS